MLHDLDYDDIESLSAAGREARALMLDTPLPRAIDDAILEACERLCQSSKRLMRSGSLFVSNCRGLNPTVSFAGQQTLRDSARITVVAFSMKIVLES
jgi:pyruvate, water dikinase